MCSAHALYNTEQKSGKLINGVALRSPAPKPHPCASAQASMRRQLCVLFVVRGHNKLQQCCGDDLIGRTSYASIEGPCWSHNCLPLLYSSTDKIPCTLFCYCRRVV